MAITIRFVGADAPEYQKVWQLREDVLRKPLGMSLKNEDLSADANDTIVIAEVDGHVIGCLMLHDVGDPHIKFRQMAVADVWQSKGIGRKLIEAGEDRARRNGYTGVRLHARMVVAGFYEKLGYKPVGDIFTEVGIPHVLMVRDL